MGDLKLRGIIAGVATMFTLLASASSAMGADSIVFNCGDDICTINPDVPFDATNFTQTGGGTEYRPSWSPDGNTIAFIGQYGSSSADVFTFNPGSTTPGAVEALDVSNTPGQTENPLPPQWSPDSSHLAYGAQYDSNTPPNPGNEVYVSPADGTSDPVPLGSDTVAERHPTWAPDGARVAFIRSGAGIYVQSSTGSPAATFLTGSSGTLGPNWSPDGSRIATIYSPASSYTVRVIRTDGSGSFVDPGSSSGQIDDVAWSPDSSRVAWIADDTVWVRAANNGSPAVPIPLPDDAALPQNVAWSPDGTRLSFDASTNPSGYSQLYVARADGSTPAAAITNSAEHNQQAFWKPSPSTGPPPPPPNPNRHAPVIRLAAFRFLHPYNPYQLHVAITCYVDGYTNTTDPACRASGFAKVRNTRTASRIEVAARAGRQPALLTGNRTIPAGTTKKLTFKVTKAGRKVFKPGKVVVVKLTITVTQANTKVRKTVKLKLRAPKKKH